jgi:hypothetical protein
MHLPNETRLELLNNAQPRQPWESCEEKRQCIMCERTFRGRDAIIRRQRSGTLHLGCPICDSGPQFWVRPGNPLLDHHVWSDWELAIASSMDTLTGQNDLAPTG